MSRYETLLCWNRGRDNHSLNMHYSGAKIDIRRIPLSKRKDAQYRADYSSMFNKISDSDWVRAFCIHEAGHVFYGRVLGAAEFTYLGPELRYNREKNDLEGHYAAIQPKPCTPNSNLSDIEHIGRMAQMHVAGGVCVSLFTNSYDLGDDGDYRRFEDSCAQLRRGIQGLTIDIPGMWKAAQGAVRTDFLAQENRNELFLEADLIRRKIFPWATTPITESSDTALPL
jgi:hypothetical protein